MRKYIATCMIAAASLASCTQNEDFTSPQNEQAKHMKFDVAYVGKNTRAATGDLTTEGLGAEKLILCYHPGERNMDFRQRTIVPWKERQFKLLGRLSGRGRSFGSHSGIPRQLLHNLLHSPCTGS